MDASSVLLSNKQEITNTPIVSNVMNIIVCKIKPFIIIHYVLLILILFFLILNYIKKY